METQPELVEPTPGADSTKLRSKHMCTGGPVRTVCACINRQTELSMHMLCYMALGTAQFSSYNFHSVSVLPLNRIRFSLLVIGPSWKEALKTIHDGLARDKALLAQGSSTRLYCIQRAVVSTQTRPERSLVCRNNFALCSSHLASLEEDGWTSTKDERTFKFLGNTVVCQSLPQHKYSKND